ncbi:MAG: hypothetical protein JO119_13910 [Acidobacteria bacterium]|nr:hypothetical protein [Acidobacteriota bacterium]
MYAWQQPYFEAVLEADDVKMSHQLLEALASIEQRLLSPIDRNSDEFRALQNTWFDVQELLEERRNSRGGGDQFCPLPV